MLFGDVLALATKVDLDSPLHDITFLDNPKTAFAVIAEIARLRDLHENTLGWPSAHDSFEIKFALRDFTAAERISGCLTSAIWADKEDNPGSVDYTPIVNWVLKQKNRQHSTATIRQTRGCLDDAANILLGVTTDDDCILSLRVHRRLTVDEHFRITEIVNSSLNDATWTVTRRSGWMRIASEAILHRLLSGEVQLIE
ncbi:Oidioi.mRNA.OKI2018_I69.YSR.g17081.t1.cds [Oikopleura dioica]|uniref:Oidioi.mRNA.OKI2018_I69.YSR.g17081.t1.cds n=1 Tax=Oikopleura dioica TaxID=34765 RepID=A0ABN7SPF1_OIKDI|nr:Oidioi.mRNA.OKI2018_I69.YSR.g17081.t1.cds [Oikopleura dioica]